MPISISVASEPRRIGGYAAVVGGLLWLFVLAANAINDGAESGVPFIGLVVVAATSATLVALIGLSAFQSRRHPVLTWAAFAIPAAGAIVGLLGVVAMAINGGTDESIIGGLSAWAISTLGLLALVLGSALFAVATWLTKSLSRAASALLLVGALLVVPSIGGLTGGLVPPAFAWAVLLVAIVAFPAGWVALGISALRVGRMTPISLEGASQ
jgi:drug/metabolite transporter (DMT)-like permease